MTLVSTIRNAIVLNYVQHITITGLGRAQALRRHTSNISLYLGNTQQVEHLFSRHSEKVFCV